VARSEKQGQDSRCCPKSTNHIGLCAFLDCSSAGDIRYAGDTFEDCYCVEFSNIHYYSSGRGMACKRFFKCEDVYWLKLHRSGDCSVFLIE